jgi:4-hydroxymandelate synthase
MSGTESEAAPDLRAGHIEWYVVDAAACAEEFVTRYGFEVYATAGGRECDADFRSIALRQGDIVLVATEGIADEHPASSYVAFHGDGVADIALRSTDAAAAYHAAVGRGAVAVAAPTRTSSGWVTAAVQGFGDVRHSFVQAPDDAPGPLPGFTAAVSRRRGNAQELLCVDHLAVSLHSGDLMPTVRFYQSVFGFDRTFSERILVGAQAMESVVVQSPARDITLVLIQPDPATEPGQINDFLKSHGGPGVQHLAFSATNIVSAVDGLQQHGVEFLQAPEAYYRMLGDRLEPAKHDVASLRRFNILVDQDHDGQLFQIFTRSTHPRRTVFFEVIERAGAMTFGSGNIKALYEAVEASHVEADTL